MAGRRIRDVPDEVVAALAARAVARGVSLNDEVIAVLKAELLGSLGETPSAQSAHRYR